MSQANVEKLNGDKQLLVRFYPDGVDPVEPTPFEATVIVDCYGPIGFVKAACELNASKERLTCLIEHVKQHDIDVLIWKHNARWRIVGVQ